MFQALQGVVFQANKKKEEGNKNKIKGKQKKKLGQKEWKLTAKELLKPLHLSGVA